MGKKAGAKRRPPHAPCQTIRSLPRGFGKNVALLSMKKIAHPPSI